MLWFAMDSESKTYPQIGFKLVSMRLQMTRNRCKGSKGVQKGSKRSAQKGVSLTSVSMSHSSVHWLECNEMIEKHWKPIRTDISSDLDIKRSIIK